MENAVAAKEQRYRLLFNSGNDAIFLRHFAAPVTAQRILEVNKAACRLLGYSEEELLQMSFPDLIPSAAQDTLQKLAWLLEKKSRAVVELDLQTKDGRIIPVEVSESLGELDGQPAVFSIARNITPRKIREAALRKSEARYRNLIEKANDLVQIIGAEGQILYVNTAWLTTLGYSREEIKGRSIFEFIHPDCLRQCERRFWQVLAGEPVDRIEVSFVAKDGRKVIVEGSSNTKLVAEDDTICIQGIFRDVTARRQTEEALAKLRQRNELLLNSIGEGVVGVDLDGRHIFVNPAAARMFGYRQEELIGRLNHRTWHHSKPDGTPYPEEECPIHLTVEEGKSHHSEHDVFWRKDGSCFPVEYVSTPIWENGRVVGAVVTFADISSRKKAEAETERLQNQLLQARKMQAIGNLAGGVAHDFNNILTAILGNLELAMMKSDSSAPNWINLANIQHAAERAVELIGQLLLFSRKQPMEFAPIDLNRTVQELSNMLYRVIGEDIAIETDLAADLQAVRGSKTNMEQVILNLAVNARDAMAGGGTLRLKTENVILRAEDCQRMSEARPGRFVCLTIADTGVGMERDMLQLIFEPFYSTKENGKGTGLGLAVVYGIVQEHKGWLQVESTPGQGSIFKVFIPSHLEGPQKEAPGQASPERYEGRGERILLVEDQEEVRHIAGITLSTHGYQVVTAENSEEARRIFEQEGGRFDLVFSDVVLPDQSGLELAIELKQRKPDLRILLSSGYTDQKSQLNTISDQGLPFLAKPYASVKLLQAVKNILAAG